jgi:hypothetical protein
VVLSELHESQNKFLPFIDEEEATLRKTAASLRDQEKGVEGKIIAPAACHDGGYF